MGSSRKLMNYLSCVMWMLRSSSFSPSGKASIFSGSRRLQDITMAFLSRAGSMLRQSVSKHIQINYEMSVASPSIFQMVRFMSSAARTKVFVGGLAWATNDMSLREAFSAYGEVYEASYNMQQRE